MVNKVLPVYFLQLSQLGLEVVLLELRVSECHADAAF